MEQVQAIEKYLRLSKVTDFYHKSTGKITNERILLGTLALLFLCNIFDAFYPLTVFLLALSGPFYAKMCGEQINFNKYFPVLAVYLWIRLCSTRFTNFDGIFFVMLWHPNSKWAEIICKFTQEIFTDKNFKNSSFGDRIAKTFKSGFKKD